MGWFSLSLYYFVFFALTLLACTRTSEDLVLLLLNLAHSVFLPFFLKKTPPPKIQHFRYAADE